jgi:hypothetical protein
MLKGLSHIGLEVKNSERTARLFQELFSAEIRYKKPENEVQAETFLRIGDIWFALIEGEGNKYRSDDHIALTVSENDLNSYAKKLSEMNIEYRFSKINSPPKSLYFYDYDNHFFELQTCFLNDEIS